MTLLDEALRITTTGCSAVGLRGDCILKGRVRAIDADKSGNGLGLAVLIALCGSLLGRNTRGGTIVVGSLNLGGSIEMVPNPVRIAELAVDKQAQTLLMPVACRRQLAELPDDMWTRISIELYKDSSDAVFKALTE